MKKRNLISLILAFAMLVTFLPSVLAENTETVTVLEDALVRAGGSASNAYGTADQFWVNAADSSYLKFDVTSLRNAVSSADAKYILSVTSKGDSDVGGDINVYGISGENRTGWSETTLTYNMTHETVGNGMDSDVSNLIGTFNVSAKETTFSVDVTSYINTVPDDGIATLKLQNKGMTGVAKFYSKENKANKPATLSVVTESVEEPDIQEGLLDSFNIEDFIPDTSAVSEDFLLPLTNADETISYTWEADNSDVLKIYGEYAFLVSNPKAREVNLTVTAAKGEKTETKSFALNVLPSEYTGEYIINENFEEIEEGELPDDGKWLRGDGYTSDVANKYEDGVLQSFMGVTEKGSTNALRIYKKSGFRFSSKYIHGVYACFGEIDKDAELFVSYDLLLDEVTNDAFVPRSSSNSTNSLGKLFSGLTAVGKGSSYEIDMAGQRTPHNFGEWNSVAIKSDMQEDTSKTAYSDIYVGKKLYETEVVDNDRSTTYMQNMMFGTDTNAAKGIDIYLDNVKVFLNEAQQIADKMTPEYLGATKEGNVIDNLNLNTVVDGADVRYFYSKDGIILDDGTVIHSSDSEEVTLYIVTEKNGYKGFAEVPLTVIAHDDIVNSFVELDIETMINSGENSQAISTDFKLSETIDDKYPLIWESSNEDAIKIENSYDAVIIRNVEDTPVTLTVKMEKDGVTLVKKFEVKVKKLVVDIDIESITGGNSREITEDFMLPSKTDNGEDIIWESSDDKKLFIFNNKAYVFPGSEAKEVTLSASGVFDGAEAKLDYNLKISPIVVEDMILVDEDFEDIETGKLPDTKLADGTDMWRLNSSITSTDPNQYNYVVNENSVLSSAFLNESNKTNKVLQAGKKEVDNTQAVVHLLLDSPMETVVNLEFDVYAEAPSHGHMWIQNSKSTTLGGDLIRFPMMTNSLYLGDLQKTFSKNTWHNLKLSVDMSNYLFDCYLDGKLEVVDGEVKQNGNVLSQICFGYGKGLKGYKLVDNIKIWVDVEKSVSAFAKSINLGDLTQVTSDLKLPALTPCGDAQITWLSTDPTILNAEGRVNRPAANQADANVTLYAIVKSNNVKTVREFDVVVKSEKSDEEAVKADFDNLIFNTDIYLTEDIPLLKKGIYGSDIIWKSSHPDIIDPETGKLTAKQFDDMNITSVTLTAVVKKGTVVSEEKAFVFKVPERNYALSSNAEASSDRIDAPVKNVSDNNSSTVWGPVTNDEDKYIILSLPNASTESVKINRIIAKGTFGGVKVSVSNSTSGSTFTQIGSSADLFLDTPVLAKRVKLEFSGDNVSVSDIGIYYIANDNLLAKEDADCVDLGNTSNITGDIALPLVGAINGSTITWKSDNPTILSDSGKILMRPSVRTQVKLTMTVKYGTSGEVVKSFNVYVAPGEIAGIITGGGGNSGSFGGGGGGGYSGSYAPKASSGTVEQTTYYNDISGYGWAEEYINSFAIKGILSVPANGKFEPGRAITRAEFLKIILLAFNISGNEDNNVSFNDVSPESWYYDIVKRGVSCGIVKGVSTNEFSPDSNITRQDIAVMLKRAMAYCNKNAEEIKSATFTDSDKIAEYAYEAVSSLGKAGIINGYEDGSFAPGEMALRAEAVVMVGRAIK